eukprot:COSAG01_NODE_14608_length_1433_cov_1.574963_2_plen_161_part_01
MKPKKSYLVLLMICMITFGTFANLPVSRQASIIDASSAREVTLEATGVYHSDKKWGWSKRKEVRKRGVSEAIKDAKKSALYYLLFNGTDPLLESPDSISKFKAIQDQFFADDQISQWISYEDELPQKTVKIKNGEAIKVTLKLRLNRERLRQYLEEKSIIV